MNDCHECASQFSSALINGVDERIAAGRLQRRKLVWLELTGCSGNIISLLDGNNPDFQYLASQMAQLVYDNSLIVKQGTKATEQLFSVVGSDFILAVEGAVTTKDNGVYNIVGMTEGRRITAYEAVKRLGEAASNVIAVGTCASDGGISAARPNPAGCVSVQSVLGRRVIKLPGCPCNPDWFLGTLAYILLFGEPELDATGRPVMFYGTTIHDRCPRRSYFDKGIFAAKLGEETCMFRLGCRGPVTRTDCPIRRWNERVNWPIGDNAPCIGCAQFGFPDSMEPFISFSRAGEEGTP
jgi:hydrogenase small subunit